MSGIINAKKSSFVVFGSGFDRVRDNSGTGDDPLQGYLFKYGVLRPMEQYSRTISNDPAVAPIDLTNIEYTHILCHFSMQQLSKSGTLPSLSSVTSWIRSITDKNGAESQNSHIGDIIPISRTDTEANILGLVCFYMSNNTAYKHAFWVQYDQAQGHWDTVGNSIIISYKMNDTSDDNAMTFSLINDGEHFKLTYHHDNPQSDNFLGVRLNLADYDFYL